MLIRRAFLISGLALASAACQSPAMPGTDAASASAPPSSSTPAASEAATIRGRAMYLQKIKMAPGADFVAQLVDIRLGRTPEAIIAETRLDDVAGSPYDFVITYDPAKLRPDRQYGIFAILYDAQGGPIFTTPQPVAWSAGTEDVGEFRMTMLDGGND